MKLSQALRLEGPVQVGLVGSGGKTTALAILARELPPPVIVSTTTHLGTWQTGFADHHLIIEENHEFPAEKIQLEGITLVTQRSQGKRLQGLSPRQMLSLNKFSTKHQIPLLLECDGARGLPLKTPGENEPVLPGFIDNTIVSAGLSGLGQPLDAISVYNHQLFSKVSGVAEGKEVTSTGLLQVLLHSYGKDINPGNTRHVVLLNQADTIIHQSIAGWLARKLIKHFDVAITAQLNASLIHNCLEPCAAIILAAGGGTRFGGPKQVLDFQGVPALRRVVLTALQADLHPIIVVTGAFHEQAINSVSNLLGQVKLVHNSSWQDGQAGSIRKGMETLLSMEGSSEFVSDSGPRAGSVIFLLVDQPQVNPLLLRSLIEKHSITMAKVVAPLVLGNRANPVLFDRSTFPDLLTLTGDQGGRVLFSKYPPDYIPWLDESMLIDIDIPADMEKLLGKF